MRHILLHPQLRSALSKPAQKHLRSQIWIRLKSQVPRPSKRHQPATPEPTPKELNQTSARSPASTATAKTNLRRGPPERILVYYGGTGRAMFLGMLRVTTILLFGAACLIVAPSCYTAEDDPWYITPLVVVGGAMPMIFVAYTSAPYVNFVHLALPAFARRSREAAVQYAKDLPPTATLYLNTMRFNTIPRTIPVRLGDLVPDKHLSRPVNFRNTNPAQRPWWMGKHPTQFFTGERSQQGRQSSAFYPEVWPDIYRRIQSASLGKH